MSAFAAKVKQIIIRTDAANELALGKKQQLRVHSNLSHQSLTDTVLKYSGS